MSRMRASAAQLARALPRLRRTDRAGVIALRARSVACAPARFGDKMRRRMEDFRNKRVTVAGLGKFGGQIAAIKWLVARGANVLVTDKSAPEKLASSREQLDGLPNITFRLGEHRVEDFTSTDLVVASPAIPPHNEF